MSETIWKQELQLTSTQSVDLPAGAEILCAREQNNKVCIWFLCNPDEPKVPRQIALYNTGQTAKITGRYLGTVMPYSLVFHVFESSKCC